MNTTDTILLLLIIVPGLFTGLKKGFIFQAVTIAAVWLGALVSYQFAKPLGAHFSEIVKLPENVVHLLSFVVIFIVVYFLLRIIGLCIKKVVKDVVGGGVDKLLGIVLGILKQALIIGLLILVFDTVNNTIVLVNRETLDASVVYGKLHDAANIVFPFIKNLIMKGIAQ